MTDDVANTNLLMFPRERIVRKIEKGLEDIEANARENYINQVVDHYAEYLVRQFALHGVDLQSNGFDKHYALTIEFLRASICKSFGIDHPLHEPMGELIEQIEQSIEDSGLDK